MIVNYKKYSKIMKFFSSALLVVISAILFSLAGVANQNHEQPGLDPSILPPTFELPKNLVTQDNNAVFEVEAVKFTGETQKSSVLSQEIDGKDNAENVDPGGKNLEVLTKIQKGNIKEKEVEKLLADTKKISVTFQKKVEKENTAPAKVKVETPEIPIAVQENNIKEKEAEKLLANTKKSSIAAQGIVEKENIAPVKIEVETPEISTVARENNIKEKETIRLAGEIQKVPAEAFKVSEEENFHLGASDILKYYQYVAYKGGQFAEAAPLSGKNNITAEDKSVINPDSGRLTYSESVTPALSENKSGRRKMYNRKEVDEHPKIITYYPPIYPFRARAKGIEGRVMLRFIVDEEGSVLEPQVVSAEPEGVFEQAALDTVVKYKLKPAVRDGECVSSVVKLTISFSINDNFLRFAQR